MEQIPTRQRIMDAALTLFSQRGYDAVGVEQIASEVGIKAPSLYKHYKNKQDIFDAIITEMERRYDEQVIAMQIHFMDASADRDMFEKLTEEELIKKVQDLVIYSLRDDYGSKFRRLLTIEQFRNQEFAELYTKRYVNHLITYHQKLFEQLIQAGILRQDDSQIMALQYVSPVYILLSLCDRQPEKEPEVLKMIERHIRQFNRVYRIGGSDHETSANK